MRERGDLESRHEPFLYHYYVHKAVRPLPHFEPEPGHPTSYAEVRADLLHRAEKRPVFLKDMAYYITSELLDDKEFAMRMVHAFLVRDPAESTLSYAKLDPEVTDEEIGVNAQRRLFEGLKAFDLNPTIIRSADFRARPEPIMRAYWRRAGLPHKAGSLEWDDTVPEGWDSVAGWHGEVLASGGVRPPDTGRDYVAELTALGPRYVALYEAHKSSFELLSALAIKP